MHLSISKLNFFIASQSYASDIVVTTFKWDHVRKRAKKTYFYLRLMKKNGKKQGMTNFSIKNYKKDGEQQSNEKNQGKKSEKRDTQAQT